MPTVITPYTPPANNNQPKANLVKNKFDVLIDQHGYDVTHEKAVRCPCVSRNTNQQSNCKNCGGTSWVYITKHETRMILHSMNMTTKYKEWSAENIGTASVTAYGYDEVAFMDRITVLDGNAIHTESLFLKKHDDTYYFNTIYDIKEIEYLALFIGVNDTLVPLVYGTDFTYSGNRIEFLTAQDYVDSSADLDVLEIDMSITIRYKHAPQLHIIDLQRETMQVFVKVNGIEDGAFDMPVHAVARRTHYVLDRQNFDGTRVLDNSYDFVYENLNPPKPECNC